MNYEKFLTKISKRRKPNLIRQLTAAYAKDPQALFFAGGLPNAELFPFKEISVAYNDGTPRKLERADLSAALQYGPTPGYPPLVKQWQEFQKKWHSPKYDDWKVHFCSGSMDGCSKIFEMLVAEGEPIMVQSPTYTGILSALLPMQPDFLSIGVDDDGALPGDIVNACEERLGKGMALPKLLYVNPTGANPVGLVFSNARKREIYDLARRYDFLILEDDAYYFLHFLDEQPRSFLSLDVDGRVLRLDSFSKIMSAGLRLGVVTGPTTLIDKLNLHFAATTLQPCSLSQVLVSKLLETWSEDDLKVHFSGIRKFYLDQRNVMLRAIEKYFTGIAEWSEPKGGMFVWLKIIVLEDVYELAMNKCIPQGLFVLPGHAFYPDNTEPCRYLRLSYSQMKPEEIDEGLCKLAAIIKDASAKKV